MKEIVGVLEDFANRREEGRSRAEYMAQLKRDLATYYGYNEFMLEVRGSACHLYDLRWGWLILLLRTATMSSC